MALLITLCLFTFLTAMITAVLKGNATRRTYLKARRDYMSAQNLVESGVHEAIQKIASDPDASSVQRTVRRGSYHAEWRALGQAGGVYEVISEGVARTGEPRSARKTIRVRVEIPRAPEKVDPVRFLAWELQ